jgi:hypothetical protein
MVKINQYSKIIAMFLLITGCPETLDGPDGAVKIINNSKEKIVWCSFSGGRDIKDCTDFYWGDSGIYDNIILPDSIGYEYFSSYAVQLLFEKGSQKYYLLNYDSVRTISWERIRDERILLKEITFNTWEDMEACDFTITYP